MKEGASTTRHTLYTNLVLQSSEAKLKVDWPKQIVFVQNKSLNIDNFLPHWVGQ